MNRLKAAALTLSALMLAAGCSSSGNLDSQQPEGSKKEALTLTIYDALFTEDEFQRFVEKPVKEKFPHITLERSTKATPDNFMSNLVTMVNAGNVPDLTLMAVYFNQEMENLKLPADLTPYIQKNKVDLSVIDPVIVKDLPRLNDNNRITSLPLYKDVALAFYNKDLFDKFGVEYPKDGMTYKQMTELAKKVARNDNGVQYIGMFPGHPNIQIKQLSLDVIDKNNKSLVGTLEGYKRVFQLQKDIFDIPGANQLKGNQNTAREYFVKQQNLAINIDHVSKMFLQLSKGTEMNWDMVTMPVFEDKLDVHSSLEFHGVYMSEASKHKDEAFSVLSLLTMSRDVQLGLSKSGRVPAMNDPALVKEVGSDFLKGKNVESIVKTRMAPLNNRSKWDNVGSVTGTPLNAAIQDIFNGGKDINTALREASEKIDKNVEAELKK
jgi:multiple sugar transport system substrate-binding protein